jgi:uncharacterized repeat protein (TIGR03806 family)
VGQVCNLQRVFNPLFALTLVLLSTSCGPPAPHARLEEPYPKKLSDWGLFTGRLADLRPSDRVVPYDINTPLFSDYATKQRFVWMPAGTAAEYLDPDVFNFPQGAVLAKTFSFDGRHVETRLLVNARRGWTPLVYVWNAAQTEAALEQVPDNVAIRWKHPSGEILNIDYTIPNTNQCKNCHDQGAGDAKITLPIGPSARQLNRDYDYGGVRENQLTHWTRVGILHNAPPSSPRMPVWDDPTSAPLEARARAYLEINCAHCHNPRGAANTTGLYLTFSEAERMRVGVCKVPVAAGNGSGDLRFGVTPGRPDESILMRRMLSVEPKILMPELGRSVVHREGAELVRKWIDSLEGDCSPP